LLYALDLVRAVVALSTVLELDHQEERANFLHDAN